MNDPPKKKKRERFNYDLTNLPKALKYVLLDIKYMLSLLREVETVEFRERCSSIDLHKHYVSRYNKQFKGLLEIRDNIIDKMEDRNSIEESDDSC